MGSAGLPECSMDAKRMPAAPRHAVQCDHILAVGLQVAPVDARLAVIGTADKLAVRQPTSDSHRASSAWEEDPLVNAFAPHRNSPVPELRGPAAGGDARHRRAGDGGFTAEWSP